jgi:hypothetical protein
MTIVGNDSEKWEKILSFLDEKLQFGALERLRRVSSYHFESDTLTIEIDNIADFEYLNKATTKTQLQIFANDACGINKIEVKKS